MKRHDSPHPPSGWTALGIAVGLVGVAFWALVICVVVHFVAKF